jgi:hypothetical protein
MEKSFNVGLPRVTLSKILNTAYTRLGQTGVSFVAAEQCRVCGVSAEDREEAKTNPQDEYQGGE